MQIDQPTPTEHSEFLALVNAEIRPNRAKTNAWDDFPLILHGQNMSWTLIARTPEGEVAGGIAALIRGFTTNYGTIDVAGIGSVVTRNDYRGQGISSSLQNAMLARLREKKIPLAVLWTDQPEIYSGRGFFPAGWEIHLDFSCAELPVPDSQTSTARQIRPSDVDAVQKLYDAHPCRTVRKPGDALLLYLMQGTTGLVMEHNGPDGVPTVTGAIFCGKGGDFPSYVHEWEGEESSVLALLAEARSRGLAQNILIPAGNESMAETLVNHGAGWEIRTSGFWNLLDGSELEKLVEDREELPAGDKNDPRYWLGGVDDEGAALPGILKIAVWGFDSV